MLKGSYGRHHKRSSAERIVMFDYECFHRSSGFFSFNLDSDDNEPDIQVTSKGGAKNYLFADWHVSDKLF